MCALHIGSFGYEVNDVEYKWKADPPVSYSKFEMAQFKLKDTRSANQKITKSVSELISDPLPS